MLKSLRNLLIFVILVGSLTAFIDYTRMVSSEGPLFSISSFNEKSGIQSYRGLFYQASRRVKVNKDEPLSDSSEITYTVLTKKISIPSKSSNDSFLFSLDTKSSEFCSNSSLYYADNDIKVYTYCLDSIDVKKLGKKSTKPLLSYLEKDNSIIFDIVQNVPFMGLYNDNSTEFFKSIDTSFTESGLIIYQCNKPYINDIYLLPLTASFQPDFCTYKDDDFKFISTIEIEDTTTPVKEKEVFYEDDLFIYEFDEVMKDRVFIVTPNVRGKAALKISLSDVLNNGLLTISELEKKGLKFNKVSKT